MTRRERGDVARITLESVRKTFPGGVTAVNDVSLEVGDGEFVALVGPSGCGKSTLLRMVAGLERVTSGVVTIGGRDVTHLPPKDRDISMVFQDYALFPQMTARQNLAFGLRARRVKGIDINARVTEVAGSLRLSDYLDRKPHQLSGGQRQRVAIGRAIIRDPQAFLMDEPLSNLDANLRTHMRGELARLRDRLNVTTVYVTHDQIEAMTLGDRVVVLDQGAIQQIDTPSRLFEHPANTFVAATIGSPSMNLVRLPVQNRTIDLGGAAVTVPPLVAGSTEIIVGIRPYHLEDAALGVRDGCGVLSVVPDVVEKLGTEKRVHFTVPGSPVDIGQGGSADETEDLIDTDDELGPRVRFTAVLDAASRAESREPLKLAARLEGFHFFDAETGLVVDEKPAMP